MQAIKPFDPSETEQIVAIAHGQAKRAWEITHKRGGNALVWAVSSRQACAIDRSYRPELEIALVRVNHHAENMHPKPLTWSEFIAMGGGQ